MILDPIAISSILAAVVLLALFLEGRFKLFRALGAALVGILLAMVLSNVGLLPDGSPVYDWLSSWGVNLSIVLILMGVDLRSILRAGPGMIAAFGLGALGTALGATAAALLLAPSIGPETWKLAGQYTGTYTGGGMNFAALGRAFETSSDLFSAAVAADVTVTAFWMMTCLAVPVLLGKGTVSANGKSEEAEKKGTLEQSLKAAEGPLHLTEIAALVTMSVSLVWLSAKLAAALPAIPQVLWLTTLAVLAAQIPLIRSFGGGPLLGNYLLLLFLAANGAQSVIANIVVIGPAVFYFAVITVAMHGLVIFGLGLLCRLKPSVLAVASQANVGGAGSALALASARGYSEELLPGIAVGLMGYAVGNYLGFVVASLFRGLG